MPTESIVFAPEISERELNREVDNVNRQLEGMASDLPVGLDSQLDATRPAGGGLNQTSGLLAFAEQRNDILVEIRELLDEDFVGSTGGGGRSVGSSILGSSIAGLILGGGGAGSAATIGAGIAASFGAAVTTLNVWRNVAQDIYLPIYNFLRTNLPKVFDTANRWVYKLTNWSLDMPDWMDPFVNWQWPSLPDWMNPFTDWQWPSTPDWMNPFTNWKFPRPPQWMSDFVRIFTGTRTRARRPTPTAARRGGAFQSDQGLFNAANRQSRNQANAPNRTNLNFDNTFDIDPARVAREVQTEVEGYVDDAIRTLERELRDSRPETATPGRR